MGRCFGVRLILATEVCFLPLLVLLMDSFSSNFVHDHSINYLSTAIGGTSFDHVRTCLIGLNFRVGIFTAACLALILVF